MSAPLKPVLVGTSGLCAGEHWMLEEGVTVAIGRSSQCEISLQRLPRYLAMSETERANLADFNTISRKHLSILVVNKIATLENLSTAGTWCDDLRFDKGKQVDLALNAVSLRIGLGEIFTLMLVDEMGLENLMARTRPMPVPTTHIRQPLDQQTTDKRQALK